MKKLLTGFAVTTAAAVWITGSWLFFNSIAAGAQGSGTAAVADAAKAGPKGETAGEGHCCKWKDGHRHHGPGHRHHALLKKLHLTDAQKAQVKTIMSEERPKIQALFKQLKAGRDQFDPLIKSGTFDEAKVRSIAKGQADTLVDLIVARERIKSRIYAILTPEQRTKAEKLREAWKTLHEQGPGHED